MITYGPQILIYWCINLNELSVRHHSYPKSKKLTHRPKKWIYPSPRTGMEYLIYFKYSMALSTAQDIISRR